MNSPLTPLAVLDGFPRHVETLGRLLRFWRLGRADEELLAGEIRP